MMSHYTVNITYTFTDLIMIISIDINLLNTLKDNHTST